jgi:hypothetical protein
MQTLLALAGIAAVLGFLGGMIFMLVSYTYVEILGKGDIVIEIMPTVDGDGSKGLIQVRNIGGEPVTNLILTIESPKEIVSYSNFSTLTGITINKITPTILRADAPKFVHGDGSLMLVYTVINGSQSTHYSNYSAYATYDQGSVRGKMISLTSVDPQDPIIRLGIGIGLITTSVLTTVVILFEFVNISRLYKIRETIKRRP